MSWCLAATVAKMILYNRNKKADAKGGLNAFCICENEYSETVSGITTGYFF